MAGKSYAFATGNVRAREAGLLKNSDIEQLLSYQSVAGCVDFLKDKGYGESDTPKNILDLLSVEEKKLWAYIRDIAPDFTAFYPLIISNDYHNLKAIIKGVATGKPYVQLLLSPTVWDTDVIKSAVVGKNFDALPEELRTPAKKAWEILIETSDAQASDVILDTAMLESKLKLVSDNKTPLISEIVRASVFFDNIKVALRCADAKKRRDFIEAGLASVAELSKEELVSAALRGRDEVLSLLEGVKKYSGKDFAEAFRQSPSQFEKMVDNYLLRLNIKAKYIAVGAEPLVAYLMARLAELKSVRIAVNAVATSADRDSVREMLRELYG